MVSGDIWQYSSHSLEYILFIKDDNNIRRPLSPTLNLDSLVKLNLVLNTRLMTLLKNGRE